ncbi:MAG TPA: cytochrome c3 family protein [Acetobacteraceae bacterium]|nr:cytochrome c3 family protein [Acetobacteraceae bacterium]
MRAALLGAGALAVFLLFWWWVWPRTDWMRRVDFVVPQPVPFSHAHHVAGLGISCLMCHNTVRTGAMAGLPPTHTCMTCHSQIWTNAALLAPVRESYASGTPIAWNRVYDLPSYVYFDHSIHIAKGVGCESCHGQVDRMPLTQKAVSLTMGFCLDCHRNPGPNLRPESAIFDTDWKRTPDTPSPAALLAQYRIGKRDILDCSTCHR